MIFCDIGPKWACWKMPSSVVVVLQRVRMDSPWWRVFCSMTSCFTLTWSRVFFPPIKVPSLRIFFPILLPCTLLENHSTVYTQHTVWMKTAWKSREYFCAQNSAKRKEKRIIILFLYTCSVGPLFYLNWHPKYSKIPNVGMVMGLIALLAIIRLLTIFQVLVHLVQFASSGQTNITSTLDDL